MTAEGLRATFGAFADPATDTQSEETDAIVRVVVTREGHRRTYVFDRATGHIVARAEVDRTFESVSSLIASPEFADLRAMAATQQRMLTEIQAAPFLEPELSVTESTPDWSARYLGGD